VLSHHVLQIKQLGLNVVTGQKAYLPCNQHHYGGKQGKLDSGEWDVPQLNSHPPLIWHTITPLAIVDQIDLNSNG
jgi:hypothetical protein